METEAVSHATLAVTHFPEAPGLWRARWCGAWGGPARHPPGPRLAAGTELQRAGQRGSPRTPQAWPQGKALRECGSPVPRKSRHRHPQTKVICQSELKRSGPSLGCPGRLCTWAEARLWSDCGLLTGHALRGGLAWPGGACPQRPEGRGRSRQPMTGTGVRNGLPLPDPPPPPFYINKLGSFTVSLWEGAESCTPPHDRYLQLTRLHHTCCPRWPVSAVVS